MQDESNYMTADEESDIGSVQHAFKVNLSFDDSIYPLTPQSVCHCSICTRTHNDVSLHTVHTPTSNLGKPLNTCKKRMKTSGAASVAPSSPLSARAAVFIPATPRSPLSAEAAVFIPSAPRSPLSASAPVFVPSAALPHSHDHTAVQDLRDPLQIERKQTLNLIINSARSSTSGGVESTFSQLGLRLPRYINSPVYEYSDYSESDGGEYDYDGLDYSPDKDGDISSAYDGSRSTSSPSHYSLEDSSDADSDDNPESSPSPPDSPRSPLPIDPRDLPPDLKSGGMREASIAWEFSLIEHERLEEEAVRRALDPHWYRYEDPYYEEILRAEQRHSFKFQHSIRLQFALEAILLRPILRDASPSSTTSVCRPPGLEIPHRLTVLHDENQRTWREPLPVPALDITPRTTDNLQEWADWARLPVGNTQRCPTSRHVPLIPRYLPSAEYTVTSTTFPEPTVTEPEPEP
jgi:hypothetical protein